MKRAKVTDELLDAYVNRPLASYVVRAVVHTKCTPNQLTFFSAMFGTIAAIGFGSTSAFATIGGAIALVLCMVFDCSDGQLARARGGGSVAGRIMDGYADYWVAIVLHVGILVRVGTTGVVIHGHTLGTAERVVFVGLAGLSMAVNAGRFDHYKHRWLAHTGAMRDHETPEMFLDEARKSDSIIERAALKLFAAYVKVGQGRALDEAVRAAHYTASDPARIARYERDNGLLLRLWGLSGPNLFLGGMCVAGCLAASYDPLAFNTYCLLAIVAVNAYTFVLWIFQRRVLRRELGPGVARLGGSDTVADSVANA